MQTLLDRLVHVAEQLPREEVERLIRHAERAAHNITLTFSLTRRREELPPDSPRQAVQL
jgi:hypothetical protein